MEEIDLINLRVGFEIENGVVISGPWQVYSHPGLYLESKFEDKYTPTPSGSEEVLADNELKLYPPVNISDLIVNEPYEFRCATGENFNFWDLLNLDPEGDLPGQLVTYGEELPFDLYLDGIDGKVEYYGGSWNSSEGVYTIDLKLGIDYPAGRSGNPELYITVDLDGKVGDTATFTSSDSR